MLLEGERTSPPILDNIFEFIELLDCDYKCLKVLEKVRWSNGFRCPRCGEEKGYRIQEYKLIQCAACKHQTSATSGTILHKSHIPLRKWFAAIFLLLTDKTGLSAQRLHSILEVSYKTALNMLKKLRSVMGIHKQLVPEQIELSIRECILKESSDNPICADIHVIKSSQIESYANEAEEQENKTKEKNKSRFSCPISITTSKLPDKQSSTKRQLQRSEVATVAGAVALTKHFLIGTFHRASSRYLQLYLDEFVYRFRMDNSIATILKYLDDCCRSSSSKAAEYLNKILAHSKKLSGIGGQEDFLVKEAASHYRAKSGSICSNEMFHCA